MDSRQIVALFLVLLSSNSVWGSIHSYYEPKTEMTPSQDSDYGILDTFSLSFVGNFNFANAIDGVKKIVEGVANCKLIS